jgi:hypothetical protein
MYQAVLNFILATGNQTIAGWLQGAIDSVVGIFLILGILGGIAGIVIYIAIGFFEMQLFTNILATSGGRKIIHALEAFIFIPVVIGILFILDQFAIQGMLGSSINDTGSFAWMIHHIWLWISQKLTTVI